MTVEARSIYSGPIRRGLERIDTNIRRIVALEAKTATTPWTSVTFQNGWVNYGAGYQPMQYRKVGDEVQLRGVIKSGTINVVAFTLPVGFRPPAAFDAVIDDTTAGPAVLDILSTGAVAPYVTTSAEGVSILCSFSVTV